MCVCVCVNVTVTVLVVNWNMRIGNVVNYICGYCTRTPVWTWGTDFIHTLNWHCLVIAKWLY